MAQTTLSFASQLTGGLHRLGYKNAKHEQFDTVESLLKQDHTFTSITIGLGSPHMYQLLLRKTALYS